ncbi:SulP family sulfate permease [Natronocella acetinitrilica]|uniref:SulP family sulfate permease n=1 Tax=Natronocella acetinitrilica TaxID=414046 RepID=A0AAE3G6H1_9GAMM|nr:SulP family inorganic anion transporter [Natronocella acetinitrilica]MCP1675283.1 SulP family sulfate permease [Natronocella acetinitrilica]
MNPQRFLPFLEWLPLVGPRALRADLMAGLTGAVIVLPQGVAYALIAGLPPQYGLYGAIVIAVIAGLFGSSRHLVSGPTAALSIVVFSVVSGVVSPDSPEFIPYVITLTMLAGVIQLGLGLARLGGLVNFISHTVVVGFTTGAAVLIASSQLRHFFGLDMPAGESFATTVYLFVQGLPEFNGWVVLIGVVTLGTSLLVSRFRPNWPSMLVAMLAGSLAAFVLGGEERGINMVGAMPASLPPLTLPVFSLETLRLLVPGALAVAIIGIIEAVSIGRAISVKSGQRIDGSQEFVGQGLGNLVGSFFSCYAGSGSFTRSAANYHAGARTPLSVVFAASLVLLILLLVPGVTAHLPMPAMAAIVLLIAWKLVDLRQWRAIMGVSRQEALILVVTFASTLILALEFAIYLGVLLSLMIYLHRTAHPRMVPVAPVQERSGKPYRNAAKRGLVECPQLKVLRLDGSIFFGAVDHVQSVLEGLSRSGYRHVLLFGPSVNFIDVAGAELLAHEARRFRALGGGLYFASFKDPAIELLKKPVYLRDIGENSFFHTPAEAVATIFPTLDRPTCVRCTARIFHECERVPRPGE